MNSRDFVYWLQGFLEIDGADDQKRIGLSSAQVDLIKKHIALVLTNVTNVPSKQYETSLQQSDILRGLGIVTC